MMAMSNITELAYTILVNTAKYNDHLLKHGLPLPSHNASSFDQKSPLSLPDDVTAALEAATEATHELHQLLLGPIGCLMSAASEVGSRALEAVAENQTHGDHSFIR